MASEISQRIDPRHQLSRSTQPDRIGIWEWDLVNNSVYYSPDWKSLRGWDSPDELPTPEQASHWVHPDDRAKRTELLNKLVAGKLEQVEFEHRVRKGDGSWGRILERSHSICNNNGKPIRLVGCEFDVSVTASPPTTAPVGIFRMSDPTTCIYVNDYWSKQTGLSLEESLGTGWMKAGHPDDINAFREEAQAFVDDPDHIILDGFEARQIRPDGSINWIKWHLAKELDDDGNITGFVGTVSDIDRVKRSEVALKEQNQNLHTVLDACSIGIWKWYWDEERLVWDETMHRIYGVDAKDFRGIYNDWSERIHPADIQRVMEEDQCRSESNQQYAQEFRIVRPNGEVRHVYSNAYTELNEFDKPVRTTGVNIDITQRREAELALQESESKLQRIADQLPGMVYRFVLNSDGTSAWKHVSSKVRDLFGVEPSELMDDRELLWQFIDPDDAVRLKERTALSAKELSPNVEDFRATVPGRGLRWFQTNSQPRKTENGSIVWDGVILDITDRKTAEFKLEEAKLQTERITENVPGVIYQHVQNADGSFSVSFISPQCIDMFGLTPEEAMHDVNLLFDKIYPEDAARVQEATAKSARTLQPLKVEYRVLLPGKGLRWHQSIGRPVRNGNRTVWNGMVLDVTDRKEAELANDILAKATKTKDQFLANMSHELRTPLTAILAMTDGLQQEMFGSITPKQMKSLKIIEQSGVHLLDLINEVLDLAKIESGQTGLELSSIDVFKLCESCLNFVTQQAEQKQMKLSLKVPKDLPVLGADEKKIRQVLINLLSNAVKFTPAGGRVQLKVETLAEPSDNALDTLRISVSDTGIGIREDQLDSLFEPFVQVDSSLTRQHGGTGLGLSLAKQLVDLHQGTIRVTSEPAKGSCFIVDLPYRTVQLEEAESTRVRIKSDLETHRHSNTSDAISNITGETPRQDDGDSQPLILLAEDNELVAESMIPILGCSNFRVLHAVNGKRAVELTLEHSPDLILMDIQMPEMDGLEATRVIRGYPEFSQLPIIALSGFAKSEDHQNCINAGMNLFLAKPLRIAELVENIHNLLNEKKQT